MLCEKVQCVVNGEALQTAHVSARNGVLHMTIHGDMLLIEYVVHQVAMRTLFVTHSQRQLQLDAPSSPFWYASCSIDASTILVATSLHIRQDTAETQQIGNGSALFYCVDICTLQFTAICLTLNALELAVVDEMVFRSGSADGVEGGSVLIIGRRNDTEETTYALIAGKGARTLKQCAQMRVLCSRRGTVVLVASSTTTDSASVLYLLQSPWHELVQVATSEQPNISMVSHGLLLPDGFLLTLEDTIKDRTLTIYKLTLEPAIGLSKCASLDLAIPKYQQPQILFDSYHNVFIFAGEQRHNQAQTKWAHRLDLLPVLVHAMERKVRSSTSISYIKALLLSRMEDVTEGLREAQIEQAASTVVTSRLVSCANSTMSDRNIAILKAEKLKVADVKQRQRILELEESRRENDSRVEQLLAENRKLEYTIEECEETIAMQQASIAEIKDTGQKKQKRLIDRALLIEKTIDNLSSELSTLKKEIET